MLKTINEIPTFLQKSSDLIRKFPGGFMRGSDFTFRRLLSALQPAITADTLRPNEFLYA